MTKRKQKRPDEDDCPLLDLLIDLAESPIEESRKKRAVSEYRKSTSLPPRQAHGPDWKR